MRISIILYFVLTFTSHVSSQWIESNSMTLQNLNEIQFVSNEIGYVIGESGILLKSIDSGTNWTILDFTDSSNLTSLHFLNTEIGFIGTNNGKLYRTSDGGANWEEIDLGILTNIEVYFVDTNIGFIGTKDLILKTTDSGLSWVPCQVIPEIFQTIYEFECLNGYCFALNKKGVLRSLDEGNTWNQILDESHPDYNPANFIESIELINDNTLLLGSPYYQGLYKTENDFNSLNFTPIVVNDIEFIDKNLGFAIIEHGREIVKTQDGGNSWTTQNENLDPEIRLTDLFFQNDKIGWAVGARGKILKTTNGGITTSTYSIVNNQVNIYPNPANDKIRIELPEETNLKNLKIEIIDVKGKIINKKNLETDCKTLDILNFATGLYFLRIYSEDQVYINRFIKEQR